LAVHSKVDVLVVGSGNTSWAFVENNSALVVMHDELGEQSRGWTLNGVEAK
jgi:hypothetical protein